MTDTDRPDTGPIASEMQVDMPKRKTFGGLSLVWLVPVVALAVALAMTWKNFSERGPLIEISFQNADGVVENQTVLKYRDVTVGKVEDVSFSTDLRNVILHVRIEKEIEPFVDSDARFWIVQPEISAQGISGLGTLLGGVYLEGTWDSVPGTLQRQFTGLDSRPLFTGAERGIQFSLSAPRGGTISAGAPIIYKGVNVGLIDRPTLATDGSAVTAKAFVRAPYDRLVTANSRFWGASGVSVRFGPSGLKVEVANLSALIQGGIGFDSGPPGSAKVEEGHVFSVFASRDDAGSDVLPENEGPEVKFSTLFDGSIAGLSNESPVEYLGLKIGSVTGTVGQVAPEGSPQALLLRVDLSIIPSRLGLEGDDVETQTRLLFARLVEEGYRARLVSNGLLGTSLKVVISQVEGADPAEITTTADGREILPSAPPDITDPMNTARTAIERLNKLPIESIVDSVGKLLDNVNAVVASASTREAPAAIVGLVKELSQFVGSSAVQGAAEGASESLESLNEILTKFKQGKAINSVLAALERSDAIAKALQTTVEGLPELSAKISALAEKATALPLEGLITEADSLITSIDGLIKSDSVQAMPAALIATLDEIKSSVASVREMIDNVKQSSAVPNVLAALERTSSIAASIDTSAKAFPDLVNQFNALLSKANAIPLQELATQSNSLLAAVEAVAADPSTKALPAKLAQSLTDLDAAVSDLRSIMTQITDSGAVASLTAALGRADSIATSLDTTAAGLPDLLARINTIATEAENLPLKDLVNSANDLVQSADRLVSSDDTAKIPAALASTLNELAATLDELREGGVVENTNAALASAAQAADSIAAAAARLPELAQKLDALVAQSDALMATYGSRSEFNAQTLAALRELRDSARAVSSLARAIELKPNSLLIGR